MSVTVALVSGYILKSLITTGRFQYVINFEIQVGCCHETNTALPAWLSQL